MSLKVVMAIFPQNDIFLRHPVKSINERPLSDFLSLPPSHSLSFTIHIIHMKIQLIYKGTLKYKKKHNITKEVQDIAKSYHELTSTSFKARHSNHMTSFRDPKYRHSTRLSTHIWELKKDGIQDFDLKFSIEKLAPAYKREPQKYLLCLEEKRFIMYKNQEESIIKRTEILNKCRLLRLYQLILRV